MSKITPALPDQEWIRLDTEGEARLADAGGIHRVAGGIAIWRYSHHMEVPRESLPALIAVSNSALHPDDPRKITRETVLNLRELAGWLADVPAEAGHIEGRIRDTAKALRGHADALEAYLPPESP